MRLLDISFDRPEDNLAFDEVLLNDVETGQTEETLRFWESPVLFVVLGLSQKLAEEVDEEACKLDDIPILRRCSAGGCVVQGPGCLNFTLVLSHEARPEIRTISKSYEYILGRLATTFEANGIRVSREGISDLAIDGLKISGNAQKRCKNAILHHGTFLYESENNPQMSSSIMQKYLLEPQMRPDYRKDRIHKDFVGYLQASPENIRNIVIETFRCSDFFKPEPPKKGQIQASHTLAIEKYASVEWIRRR